jgi:opacity protein-like surface antigen
MHLNLKRTTFAAVAFALAAPGAALAQQQGSGLTMPYQKDFWGHVGASIGRSKLDTDCIPGTECDDKDRVLRVFGGGRFNNAIGGEIAWMDLGDFTNGGGDTDSQALDLALVAGIPFANNWSVFGKLGAVYARSEVSGTAAGLETGERNGWGPRVGIGLQMGLTENWALRADLDRYRIRLPGGRENIDTFMVGAQYSFR